MYRFAQAYRQVQAQAHSQRALQSNSQDERASSTTGVPHSEPEAKDLPNGRATGGALGLPRSTAAAKDASPGTSTPRSTSLAVSKSTPSRFINLMFSRESRDESSGGSGRTVPLLPPQQQCQVQVEAATSGGQPPREALEDCDEHGSVQGSQPKGSTASAFAITVVTAPANQLRSGAAATADTVGGSSEAHACEPTSYGGKGTGAGAITSSSGLSEYCRTAEGAGRSTVAVITTPGRPDPSCPPALPEEDDACLAPGGASTAPNAACCLSEARSEQHPITTINIAPAFGETADCCRNGADTPLGPTTAAAAPVSEMRKHWRSRVRSALERLRYSLRRSERIGVLPAQLPSARSADEPTGRSGPPPVRSLSHTLGQRRASSRASLFGSLQAVVSMRRKGRHSFDATGNGSGRDVSVVSSGGGALAGARTLSRMPTLMKQQWAPLADSIFRGGGRPNGPGM
ncbi:hypothetical protein PLESTF_001916500 [Pleodorina starrii]|nr:hypothetical protein PLESTF_001916500 [Pleodorina starrii]